jgi:hypothetical protein
MARALEAYGVRHHLELVEDRGHAFDQDIEEPVVAGIYARILEFLAEEGGLSSTGARVEDNG